jgi:hypothetical protein
MMNVLEGVCSDGVAKTIFDVRETRNAQFITGRWREIRWQQEFDACRVIGEEDGSIL